MKHAKWNDFTNLLKWSAFAYRDEVAPIERDEHVVKMSCISSMSRRIGDWEVHVFFSGNDGCWKWSADKRENIGKNEYPYMVYDEIGMTFLDCMEECFGELMKKGVIA